MTKKSKDFKELSKKEPTKELPGLSPEDIAIWQHVIKDVDPLPGKETIEIDEKMIEQVAKEQSISTREVSRVVEKMTNPKVSESEYPYLKPGDVKGVDRHTSEKLKRGQYPIQARIDLHGCTQDEALSALRAFLYDAHDRGKRCVLVITGKGMKSDGSKGVLYQNVPRWLNNPDIRPLIVMCCYAAPSDGGEGALYILLRKKTS